MAQMGFGLARKAALAMGVILGMTASIKAGPFTFSGTSSGTFDNPNPAGSLTSGVSTANFSWGDPGSTGSVSSLSFTGGSFNGQEGQTFTIGTLQYTNGVTFGGEPSAVDLNLKLSFDNPKIPDVPLTLTASIFTTPNTGTPPQNYNTVLFDFGQLLVPAGQTTTVAILGLYDSDNGFQVFGFGDVNDPGSPDGNSGPAITPEPSSLLLACLGLAGLGLAGQKEPVTSSATATPRSAPAE